MTSVFYGSGSRELISIHTLTQRVTLPRLFPLLVGIYFNPHPHAEGDLFWQGRQNWRQNISIHTLTQRVTWGRRDKMGQILHFNPHPHAEGDPALIKMVTCYSRFQSTPSRRGWQLHLVSLNPKHSIYRSWYNLIQLICWKSQSISTTYYLFECESP